MKESVGVSILTNGRRLEHLKRCVHSLLKNCYYRPLTIGIFDNGSEDDVVGWVAELPEIYGINWRYDGCEEDKGCAVGTNKASELVNDCRYVLHLESDFVHLPADMSGEDRMWLNRAVEFMETGVCDYLYLRRMVNEEDIRLHWWSQWMPRIDSADGRYMRCHGFWWSNNPHLRHNSATYEAGCLPLNEGLDGPKGTGGWSQPELQAPRPMKTWIHKWGMFVHDIDPEGLRSHAGCFRYGDGHLSCKYGFFKDVQSGFCKACRGSEITDMDAHYKRFINA